MVWIDSPFSWKKEGGCSDPCQERSSYTTLNPARCPFQCRCKNTSVHHICSVGSCSCYNNRNYQCGCATCICNSEKWSVELRERDFHFRPTVAKTGCHVHRDDESTFAITGRLGPSKHRAGNGKMLEFANLNALRRRLSFLQDEMRQNSELERLKEILLTQASDICVTTTTNNTSLGDQVGVTSSPGSNFFIKHHSGRLGAGTEEPWQEICDAFDVLQECSNSVSRWKEYNCDPQLRRVMESSRKCIAFKLLEDIHQRLTCHMHAYINSVAKGLIGDDKTHYLSFFKKKGPFKLKPLKEGTYSELLEFISKHEKPARDLIKALDVAEDGLIEEAHYKGYNASEIGDIRSQMARFFLVRKEDESPDDDYDTPFTDKDMLRGCIRDLKQAASDGKLGLLDDAAKLVKLGCFLSCQQLA